MRTWTVGGSLISRTDDGTAVARVLHRPKVGRAAHCDQDDTAPLVPEADANGRVLAAAPELLAFVRKLAAATYSENRALAHTVTDDARYLLARIEAKA